MPVMRRGLIFASLVMLASAVLTSLAFAAIVVSFDRFPGSEQLQHAFAAADLPVSLFNRVLPDSYKTHFTYFLRCNHTYCFPDAPHIELGRYLRVGVPAYGLLFSVPVLVARRFRRFLRDAR